MSSTQGEMVLNTKNYRYEKKVQCRLCGIGLLPLIAEAEGKDTGQPSSQIEISGSLHRIVLSVLDAEFELCPDGRSSSEDPAAEYWLHPNQ